MMGNCLVADDDARTTEHGEHDDQSDLRKLSERVKEWKARAAAAEAERDRERARSAAMEQRIGEWKQKNADLTAKRDRLEARLETLEAKKAEQAERLERTRPAYKHFDRVLDFADAAVARFEGRQFGLCIAHDGMSLEAARSIVAAEDCPLVVDMVEHPDLAGLGGVDAAAIRACRRSQLMQTRLDDMLRRADRILTVSRCVGAAIRDRIGGAEPVVVMNCRRFVPAPRDRTIRVDCGLGEGDRLVVYPNDVSRVAFLDAALGALARMPADVHLAQMGSLFADVEEARDRLVAKHGVGDRFHQLPPLAPDAFVDYRAGADAALIVLDPAIPNHRVSLPNRLFETVMSRTPVAATALECIGELIDRFGFGATFVENRPEAIAAALMRVLDDPSYRERIEDAAHKLSWENELPVFVDAVAPLLPEQQTEILFLANKRVATNDRCARLVNALLDMGHKVTFAAIDLPHEALRDSRATYEVLLGGESEAAAPVADQPPK